MIENWKYKRLPAATLAADFTNENHLKSGKRNWQYRYPGLIIKEVDAGQELPLHYYYKKR